MSLLAQRIDAEIDKHGGLRQAGRALNIDPAYLHRLRSGECANPSDSVLKKLGLKKVVTYERL